jgi:hypothetical protein
MIREDSSDSGATASETIGRIVCSMLGAARLPVCGPAWAGAAKLKLSAIAVTPTVMRGKMRMISSFAF